VKRIIGHTLSMTLRYAHLAPSHKVKAITVFDNTLNGRASIQCKEKESAFSADSLNLMVGATGLEPVASVV
jgi:hypothetical protein